VLAAAARRRSGIKARVRIPLPPALASNEALTAALRAAFPRYTVTQRAGVPLVGDGLATGVFVKVDGPGFVKTLWAFPSVVTQLLVTLSILGGILPGLTLVLLVWLATRADVARMEREIATVLAGGPSPQQAVPGAGGGPLAGAAPPPPSPGTLVVASAAFVKGLSGLLGLLMRHGALANGLSSLLWIGLGVAAVLVHQDESRAQAEHRLARPAPAPGPGRVLAGVTTLLLGLSWLLGIWRSELDFWLVESLLATGVWVYAGVGLLASEKRGTRAGVGTLVVAGEMGLTAVAGLIQNVVSAFSGDTPGFVLVRLIIASVTSLAFAGGLVARYLAHRGTPAVAGGAPAFQGAGGAPAFAMAPAASGPSWRVDPDLAGRFHPQSPDDLQVVVHDGEPRRTRRAPESCWVRVQTVDGVLRVPNLAPGGSFPPAPEAVRWIERRVYRGTLLNQPHALTETRKDGDVLFVHAPGIPHPVQVRPDYLQERPRWAFVPCDRCGADQALDPPSVMARTRFPDAPAGSVPVAFTAFCPCGGTMMVSALAEPVAAGAFPTPSLAPPGPAPYALPNAGFAPPAGFAPGPLPPPPGFAPPAGLAAPAKTLLDAPARPARPARPAWLVPALAVGGLLILAVSIPAVIVMTRIGEPAPAAEKPAAAAKPTASASAAPTATATATAKPASPARGPAPAPARRPTRPSTRPGDRPYGP